MPGAEQPSDHELIEAIRAGDGPAFETFYHRYRDWVVGLAYRFCGNREDALDVLQETFAYLLRKMPDFELRARMKTFLYPAVKHLALRRKELAHRQAPLETDPEAVERPSDDVEGFLRHLPEEQREVVWLRFSGGLALKEIAEALSIPLGTVKSRLHAALKALREQKNF